jgi:hypothetical protein
MCFHETDLDTLGFLAFECLKDVSLDLQLGMLIHNLVKLFSSLVLTLVIPSEEYFQSTIL